MERMRPGLWTNNKKNSQSDTHQKKRGDSGCCCTIFFGSEVAPSSLYNLLCFHPKILMPTGKVRPGIQIVRRWRNVVYEILLGLAKRHQGLRYPPGRTQNNTLVMLPQRNVVINLTCLVSLCRGGGHEITDDCCRDQDNETTYLWWKMREKDVENGFKSDRYG